MPTDGVVSLGAGISADTVMIKFESRAYIHWKTPGDGTEKKLTFT